MDGVLGVSCVIVLAVMILFWFGLEVLHLCLFASCTISCSDESLGIGPGVS
jgi:hypothetical protein